MFAHVRSRFLGPSSAMVLPLAMLGAVVFASAASATQPYTYSVSVANKSSKCVSVEIGGYNVQGVNFTLLPGASGSATFNSPKSYLVSATDGSVTVSKRLSKAATVIVSQDRRGRITIQ